MRIIPVIERLLKKIEIDQKGCWIWTGKRRGSGYGGIKINGKDIYTHRFSYEFYRGLIPEGLTIDHLCRTRACANPDHLEAVPNRVNLLRGEGFVAQEARQTKCKHGHPFDLFNTYFRPDGNRDCHICRHEAETRRYRKRQVSLAHGAEQACGSESCACFDAGIDAGIEAGLEQAAEGKEGVRP